MGRGDCCDFFAKEMFRSFGFLKKKTKGIGSLVCCKKGVSLNLIRIVFAVCENNK